MISGLSPPRPPPEARLSWRSAGSSTFARDLDPITGPGMPSTKTPSARSSPYENAGSDAVNATVARVAPAILELLADGVPRTKLAIVEALAGRHDKQDVVHALIRLAVTGRVEDAGGKYALVLAGEGS